MNAERGTNAGRVGAGALRRSQRPVWPPLILAGSCIALLLAPLVLWPQTWLAPVQIVLLLEPREPDADVVVEVQRGPVTVLVPMRRGAESAAASGASGPPERIARLPYSFDRVAIRADGTVRLRRAFVLWGERTLWSLDGEQELGLAPLELGVSPMRSWHFLALAARNALGVGARAVAFLALSWLLGLWSAVWLVDRLLPIERHTLSVAVGLAVPIALSAALTRAGLTGTQSFWFGTGLLAVGSAATLLAYPAGRRLLRPAPADGLRLAALVGLGLIAAFVMFFPIVSYPRWFFGQAYTDSYFYFNAAEGYRRISARDMLASDWRAALGLEHLLHGIFTYSERSGDVLSLLHAALLQQTGARAAYAQHHFNCWLTLPLLGYCLLGRVGAAGAGRWIGAALLSLSAVLYALFSQCYLAQFLSVVILLAALLTSSIWLGEYARSGLSPGAHAGFITALALILASWLGSYHAHFIFPFVLVAALAAIAVARRDWRPLGLLVATGAATAAASNLALVTAVAATAQAPAHLEYLNGLARNHVFPFYRDPLHFGGIVAGVRDWVGTSAAHDAIKSDLSPPHLPRAWSVSRPLRSAHTPLAVLAVLAALYGALWAWRASLAGRLLVLTGLAYAGAAAASLCAGQLYMGCKFLISLGVPLMLWLAVGVAGWVGSGRRPRAAVAILLAAALASANTLTAWYDNSPWLLTRRHPLLYRARTHVGAITSDLRELDEVVQAAHVAAFRAGAALGTQYAVVYGDYRPGRGTNRDLIVMAHVYHSLRDFRILHDPPVLDPGLAIRWVVVLDQEAAPASAQLRCVLRNGTLTLCEVVR